MRFNFPLGRFPEDFLRVRTPYTGVLYASPFHSLSLYPLHLSLSLSLISPSLSISLLVPFSLSLLLSLFSLPFSLAYLMDVFVLVSFYATKKVFLLVNSFLFSFHFFSSWTPCIIFRTKFRIFISTK